jgi:N6-adenosine-specific RNA methylase IME4
MTGLIRYDAACRAIAEARAVDEVKDIRDKADALRMYWRQAKNRAAEIDMAEIRFRAERRIGEIKKALRAAGELHEGGRPSKTSDTTSEVSKIKLSDLEIDDRMSARAEHLADVEPNAFDRLLARWRAHQEQNSDRVSLNLLKEDKTAKRKAEHEQKTYNGGKIEDLHALAASGFKAGAILADPAWQFIARSDKGEGRSASQHYDVQGLEAIKALPIKQLAADDCVLFMWMLDWCPHWAFEVIEAWGFEHKTTAFTWIKLTANHDGQPRYDGLISDRDFHFGQGYWTRANPEDCWLATRGSPKRINADVRQLIIHPVMEHSRKPDEIHTRIERLVDGPYLELNARREAENWLTWGNEVEFRMPEPSRLADDGSLTDSKTGEILGEAAE